MPDEASQEYYYKGTNKGMVSEYDRRFVYHLGLNVHPDPDKSDVVCGRGIHLAKDVSTVKKYAEVYRVKAGIIYGEDYSKIRVGHCWVIDRINPDAIPPGIGEPLCGSEWLNKHIGDHTQAEIDALGMEIITERHHTTVKAGMTAKNLRTALTAVTK
jgi:hypothetical protein